MIERTAEISAGRVTSREVSMLNIRISPRFLSRLALVTGISLLVACGPLAESTPTATIPSNVLFFLPREGTPTVPTANRIVAHLDQPNVVSVPTFAPRSDAPLVPTRTPVEPRAIGTPMPPKYGFGPVINVATVPVYFTPTPSEQDNAHRTATAVVGSTRRAVGEATYRALPSSTRQVVDTVTAQWAAEQTAIAGTMIVRSTPTPRA